MDIANIRKVVAVADAVVGVDMLQVSPAEPNVRTPYARKMDGIAITGSAAVGDFIIDLFVNGTKKGTYSNTSTGLGMDKSKDLIPLNLFVPANALIEARIIDAANTNPVVIQLEFDKPDVAGRTFRRSARRSYTPRRTSSGRSAYRRTTGMY